MAIVDQRSPTQTGSSSTSYTWSAPSQVNVDIDIRRIGRCLNLEAMLGDWMRKHGYRLVMYSGWHHVHKGDDKRAMVSFPVYELALQYVLDAIDKDIAK
jgi:hypothetical protein